jgi:NADH:ubiquinone oxidoreductase subunit K
MLINILIFVFLAVFLIAVMGIILNRKNTLILLMCLELMFLSINLISIGYSIVIDDLIGQIFSLYILCIAGAESSVGLAILVIYYRLKGTITASFINIMKG